MRMMNKTMKKEMNVMSNFWERQVYGLNDQMVYVQKMPGLKRVVGSATGSQTDFVNGHRYWKSQRVKWYWWLNMTNMIYYCYWNY